jgi:K+-sensing histidine kinase KdpD
VASLQTTIPLLIEKMAADAARREAEVANRAKTQFFTAASHDLRQPLHAMGLFAEALRQKNHDVEVAHLVNSINESVDALEGLFSQLLDITRIDSGGVEVEPRHFAMGDLFRKLRLHFEPIAFEKGLALRFRGDARIAHADPLLVERIARNLVSNAIRYTSDGSVLVSCRRRNGRLLLQVWDTGTGIDAREQSRVFEEFYQVPGVERSLQHERRGLGLGLAIVLAVTAFAPAPLPQHFLVLMLSVVVGFYVIGKVHHALHTPLMSVTNAISGIIVVGAIGQLASTNVVVQVLAAVGVLLASINIFGGFAVTRRMLKMFSKGGNK